VSTKAKKKVTTPPTPVLAVALTPLAAFAEPVALGAITTASGPPTVTLAYARGTVTTIAMGPLAREVGALPLSRLMSLKDAFKLASDCLGSYELAAQDLAQRARTRQLTIVAQVVGRDKRVFLLRPEFWRWYKVVWARPRPEDGRPEVFVDVNPVRDNPVRRAVGEWYWFVGRRRLERLYSATSSSMPETRLSTSEVDTTGSRSVLRQQTGPKTARDWQDHVLREVVRGARAGRRLPTGPELADFLQQLGITVEPTAINKFLRDVDAGR
jgi:hypothetical protein